MNSIKYESCRLCPRKCGTNRFASTGVCNMPGEVSVARAALHYWEEPCISGKNGSGAVFFVGCPMHCIFCQNYSIANAAVTEHMNSIDSDRLKDIFFELKEQGANNINLVTPDHFIPTVAEAIAKAKNERLNLPFVYNTSSYVNVEALKMLDGLIDVYLPDFKYMDEQLAYELSGARDYPVVAKLAIEEMLSQVGETSFIYNDNLLNSKEYNDLDETVLEKHQVLITKGVIVRHLLLPGNTADSKRVIKKLLDWYGDRVYISIMNQYTPVIDKALAKRKNHMELLNKVTEEEYEEVLDFAIECGIENGFIQEGDTAMESFIPEFSERGVF